MTVEVNIQRALLDRVRTLVTAPSMPVAWPNDDFTPTVYPYLAVQHLPNRNTRITIKGSGPHLRQGILQLTVVHELNSGPRAALALAGAVAGHFPADQVLIHDGVQVRIEAAPDVAPAIRDDKTWRTPVSIRYQAFA